VSDERRFRGGMDGHERPFDGRALADQHGVGEEEARELLEEAARQASRQEAPRREQERIYIELLREERRGPDVYRPAPGKVARTMHLGRAGTSAAGGRVMLGNEMGDADRSLRELHDSDYHYVLAVGANAGVDPDLARPLLGVTILNYTGQGTTQAVWLLAALAPLKESAEVESDEALFIIPVSGPLVLDHLEKFSAASSARSRKQWAEKGARALAVELANAPLTAAGANGMADAPCPRRYP